MHPWSDWPRTCFYSIRHQWLSLPQFAPCHSKNVASKFNFLKSKFDLCCTAHGMMFVASWNHTLSPNMCLHSFRIESTIWTRPDGLDSKKNRPKLGRFGSAINPTDLMVLGRFGPTGQFVHELARFNPWITMGPDGLGQTAQFATLSKKVAEWRNNYRYF